MTHESHLIPCFTAHSKGATEILHRCEMDEEDTVFPYIQSLFDWDNLPVINIDGLGDTGYLDFLKKEHLPKGSSVVRGVDSAGRPFVAFLCIGTDDDGETHSVGVLHRRYRKGSTWVVAGIRIPGVVGAINDDGMKSLVRFFHGEEIANDYYTVSLG